VIAGGVRSKQRDRILGPVGREHVGAAERSREGRQAETRAELEDARAYELARRDVLGERDAARPQLGPVWEELLVREGVVVDQLLGARRTQQRQRPPRDDELVLDQSCA
jgi:hypothetical protein